MRHAEAIHAVNGDALPLAAQLPALEQRLSILKEQIEFPESAWYQPRQRYRADKLIRFLMNKVGQDTVMVGLSVKDISTTKGKVYDSGLMGLGFQPGRSCVVSTFRLSKKNTMQQFKKLVLHEVGHNYGLPHCPDSSCFMRDAKGKNHFDELKGYCKNCITFLKKKGFETHE